MTPRFGPVMQLGFVVPDLDRAMAHWTGNVGVGPFYVMSTSSSPRRFTAASRPMPTSRSRSHSGATCRSN